MIVKIRKQSDVTKNDYNYKVNIEEIDTNNNEDNDDNDRNPSAEGSDVAFRIDHLLRALLLNLCD
eukprot:15363563-Ditylum_brightwellii.AAC.2